MQYVHTKLIPQLLVVVQKEIWAALLQYAEGEENWI